MPPNYALSTRSPVERLLYAIWSFRLRSIIVRNHQNTSSSAVVVVVVAAAAAAAAAIVSSLTWYNNNNNGLEPPRHRCNDNNEDNDNKNRGTAVDRSLRLHLRLSPLVERLLSTAWKRRRRDNAAVETEIKEAEDALLLEEQVEEEPIDMTLMNHIGTCLCQSVCFSVG